MYRVFDVEMQRWIKDGIYLAQDSKLYIEKNGLFGFVKLIPEEEDRYVVHRYTGVNDKNENQIYEGDFLRAKVDDDREVTGLVSFIREFAAYVILCFDSDEYFTIGSEVSDYIEIIGNVFDGQDKT